MMPRRSGWYILSAFAIMAIFLTGVNRTQTASKKIYSPYSHEDEIFIRDHGVSAREEADARRDIIVGNGD